MLHAKKLTIERADAATPAGTHFDLAARSGPNGALELVASTDMPAGLLTLTIDFRGQLPETNAGLYRVQSEARWYAFTQFEAIDARRAFPCFDQPSFKTPYSVTLQVPATMKALANAPATAEHLRDDMREVQFATTAPLPTYLVAFAVGDFDIVAAPANAAQVPIRVVTTKGKGKLSAFALERAPALLKAVETYFGSPYPFAKLDLVAVPNFAAGAMENVGLVTFREVLLLVDAAQATARQLVVSQIVIAHELAHMWFGNLVTPAWWDDLWLNESFATWLAARIVGDAAPKLELWADAVRNKLWVMDLDAKESARSVRNPVQDEADINNAFDGITYTKGAAVLTMLETWLGRDAFRQALRDFIGDHRGKSVTSGDLITALANASKQPVANILQRFLDQPGTPLVTVDVTCGKPDERAVLDLTQTRYRVLGSAADPGEPWQVPMCLAYGDRRSVMANECLMLSNPRQQRRLSSPGCPTWLRPNIDEQGYYMARLPPRFLKQLTGRARKSMPPTERAALMGHLSAQMRAGQLPVGQFADQLVALSRQRDLHRTEVSGIIDGFERLERLGVAPHNERRFQRMVRRALGRHIHDLFIRHDTPVQARRLSRQVIGAAGRLGADQDVRRMAWDIVDAFFNDPQRDIALVGDEPELRTPEQLSLYLPLAAAGPPPRGKNDAKAKLWQALVEALKQPHTPIVRSAIVSALGSFPEPELVASSLDLTLDGTLQAQDLATIGRQIGSKPSTVQAVWRWLKSNLDRIEAQLGEHYVPYAPRLVSDFCTDDDAKNVAAFFGPKRAQIAGGIARNLAQTLETIDDCVRQRQAHGAAFNRWLKRHR